MPARPASIKVRALQWLAQREHSREELRAKLLRLLQRQAAAAGPPSAEGSLGAAGGLRDPARRVDDALPPADAAAEVDALLGWLEQHGYLSQARFVESRVHARQSRFGNQRIRQELQHHGITLDGAARQALQQSEHARAREVWRKRYGHAAEDAAARLRQMRFLAGRGFSIDVIRRVLKDAADGGIDDAGDAPGA